MESILDVIEAIKSSQKKANQIINDCSKKFYKSGLGIETTTEEDNVLYYMDNINVIKKCLSLKNRNTFDLLYLDPPFFTNLKFNKNISIDLAKGDLKLKVPVYSDYWANNLYEYLEMITTRLILMRDLLSDNGTIYVHIDYRVVHYIRLIMDYVFGKERFLNEIIWAYKSGGAGRRSFSKKHDNILVYTKTKNYIFNVSQEKSYNRDFKPYGFKNTKEYKDEKGWFTLVNSKDVWNIDMVGRTSAERVDYATQKPYKLLEKIILTSSREGSLVGDFFVGSGTSLIVAEKLGRRWVASDKSIHSIIEVKKRLKSIESKYTTLWQENINTVKIINNTKITLINNCLKIDLTGVEFDSNFNNILDKSIREEDIFQVNYLKENLYLFIDYISVISKSQKNQTIVEIFRPNIKKIDTIPIAGNNLDDIHISFVDVWGNEYTN